MKTGKWIKVRKDSPIYECSTCGELYYLSNDFNYCPHCGAYMKTINKVKPIRICCKTCKYSIEAYTFYGDGIYMKKLVCLGEKESPEVDKSHRCKHWRAK